MTTTADAVGAIYLARSANRSPIRPFVGAAFEADGPDALRILVVGINACVSREHASTPPETFANWFSDGRGRHRYQRAVRKHAGELAAGLADSTLFAGQPHRGLDSLYVTNCVKQYLPADLGKRDSAKLEDLINQDLTIWQGELAELARRDRLPHLIVVLGRRFWGRAWRTFRHLPGVLGEVEALQGKRAHWSSTGPSRHYANRFQIGGQNLLLVGLHHPGRGGTRKSLDKLLNAPDFKWLAGLSDRHPDCIRVTPAATDALDLGASNDADGAIATSFEESRIQPA